MIKSYLINLDKDEERLKFFTSSFNRLGLEFERIPAVDGRLFSEEDFQAFLKERPRSNKTWLRGQMGCFLSHYNAWQKIAQGSDRFYAVFEDDIHMSDDLKSILADDSWIPDNADIVRLETSPNRIRLTRKPLFTYLGRPIYGVESTSWCAGGYIINRFTAQKLIALSPKFHQPSDNLLYCYEESIIAKELRVLQFHPALCTQDKYVAEGSVNFFSNIENHQSKADQLATRLKLLMPTKFMRGIYRSLMGYKRIGFR